MSIENPYDLADEWLPADFQIVDGWLDTLLRLALQKAATGKTNPAGRGTWIRPNRQSNLYWTRFCVKYSTLGKGRRSKYAVATTKATTMPSYTFLSIPAYWRILTGSWGNAKRKASLLLNEGTSGYPRCGTVCQWPPPLNAPILDPMQRRAAEPSPRQKNAVGVLLATIAKLRSACAKIGTWQKHTG